MANPQNRLLPIRHPRLKIRLLRKNNLLEVEELTEELIETEEGEPEFSRIRCPLCEWEPKPSSRWTCWDCAYPEYYFNGCGTSWNTFNTRGKCPGCGHQWEYTACLRCNGWSLHQDWYV